MSCNGCRVLRKGCSDNCILRPCLQSLDSPESQAHATLYLAKFFGRAALMSLISNVPQTQRPALFQSLLFEACGRTVNPVNGAVGLLGTGNWRICQAAVDTVLRGGILCPVSADLLVQGRDVLLDTDSTDEEATCTNMRSSYPAANPMASKKQNGKRLSVGMDMSLSPSYEQGVEKRQRAGSVSEESGTSDELGQNRNFEVGVERRSDQVKLLELFR